MANNEWHVDKSMTNDNTADFLLTNQDWNLKVLCMDLVTICRVSYVVQYSVKLLNCL
jgi:hypothetical protein